MWAYLEARFTISLEVEREKRVRLVCPPYGAIVRGILREEKNDCPDCCMLYLFFIEAIYALYVTTIAVKTFLVTKMLFVYFCFFLKVLYTRGVKGIKDRYSSFC